MVKEKYEWEKEIIKLFKKDLYKAEVLVELASIILDTYNKNYKNYNTKNKTLKDYRRQSTVDLYMEELLQLITKAFNVEYKNYNVDLYMEELLQLITKAFNVEYKKQTKLRDDSGGYTINTTPKL